MTQRLTIPAILFLSAAALPAATVTIAIGDGGLPTQIGTDGSNVASSNGLIPANGNMWGISNGKSAAAGNVFGMAYDSYSNIAGSILPTSTQAGTYVFTATVGNDGIGGNKFPGLNTPAPSDALLGVVAGFFTTVTGNAQTTKNNMFNQFNGVTGVTYTAPTAAAPTAGTFTTWTFTWVVAEGSSVIGSDPNFGVYTKTGTGGGNAFWDDSTLSFTAVPEPSAFLLGLFGVVPLLRRRRH